MKVSSPPQIKPILPFAFKIVHFDVESFDDEYSYEIHNLSLTKNLSRAVAKRKAEYLAGRICARDALAQLGQNNYQVISAPDRAPIWPKGYIGSITHTKGIAMAIAASETDAKGLGIDIEKYMSEKQERELQKQLLHPAEGEQFALLSRSVSHPLTLIFSAKESIYKALYGTVKKFFGFDAVKLKLFNQEKLTFEVMQNLCVDIPKGTVLTVYYQQLEEWVLTECQYD